MNTAGKRAGGTVAVTVRPMSASDIAAALFILEESPQAAKWSGGALLDASSRGIAWTGEVDELVAGILIGRVAADEFEIQNLAVAMAHRRQGVATRLVGAALESARIGGSVKAYLEARASNEGAIALYSKMGFRISGRRAKYYCDPLEDAVLLALDMNGTPP
jgi:ribosomal protein S18 acetylase RimI-like enzyme